FLEPTGATYKDVSAPINEFIYHPISCSKVLIIENKMNFLTFPEVPEGLAILGKGFAIEILKDVRWLTDKVIYYWSDLNVQGFEMLSRLKLYFPHAKSFLMDSGLLDLFADFIVTGTQTKVTIQDTLIEDENIAYNTLKSKNQRLEQERIPQWYVLEKINDLTK
ncbi:MAG: Wadjet anti-phage system protein JetD domain-containing protein, partial [Flammeovirgaceae bacterium]